MTTGKFLILISAVLLLSAVAIAEERGSDNKTTEATSAKITKENATALAINYAKSNLGASANVTLVEIELESGGKMYNVKLRDNAREFSLSVDAISGAVSAEEKGKEVKETPVKDEEKKKEEMKEEEKEKGMKFEQAGNDFNGKYVSFQYSNGSIMNFSLGGRQIFNSLSIIGFTPGRIKAEGSEVKIMDKEDEEKIELEIHDNPIGLMKISTKENASVTFTLAAGLGANVGQNKVELIGVNASIVRVGQESDVKFTLSGNVLNATLDHAKIMFKAVPLTARTEKERELDENVSEDIARGKIGAIVHVDRVDSNDIVSLDQINVTVREVKNNTVTLDLSAELPQGKIVLIGVSNDILKAMRSNDVKVLLDGAEIQMADNYADIATSGEARYLIVIGAKDVEVLVFVPSFSVHQITVTTSVKAPGFAAVFGLLSLALAAWYLTRRM